MFNDGNSRDVIYQLKIRYKTDSSPDQRLTANLF